nr:hypothetical protein [Mycobacterium sp. SM1]
MRQRAAGGGVRPVVDAAGAWGGDDQAAIADEDPDEGPEPRLDLLEGSGLEVREGRLEVGGEALQAVVEVAARRGEGEDRAPPIVWVCPANEEPALDERRDDADRGRRAHAKDAGELTGRRHVRPYPGGEAERLGLGRREAELTGGRAEFTGDETGEAQESGDDTGPSFGSVVSWHAHLQCGLTTDTSGPYHSEL